MEEKHQYYGVFRLPNGKYTVLMDVDKASQSFGSYSTPEDAAADYDM